MPEAADATAARPAEAGATGFRASAMPASGLPPSMVESSSHANIRSNSSTRVSRSNRHLQEELVIQIDEELLQLSQKMEGHLAQVVHELRLFQDFLASLLKRQSPEDLADSISMDISAYRAEDTAHTDVGADLSVLEERVHGGAPLYVLSGRWRNHTARPGV
eukprot:gnl/TRDRNA2_/TRDRNA2_151130_c0_seq1.p1 gnl/TRDRNA2_/TRDRNA2_151130_c0~~gnl/TRDRNA2_/TRDRNA2_151130_c0_seq1.p1  ORF type:complete len:189 (+),score=15.88 gnl/TRDRNA2_/TRDRNA2_151130_c0_seq1:84-569(+)